MATLFIREDAVEAAWAVVDPVLETHHRARPYKRSSWGRKRLTRSFLGTAVGTIPERRRHQVDVPPHALCWDEVLEGWMSV
ncbi:MAG: hypothetical protein WBV26_07905 [Candidatus Sulfotelmatobacter sp.]